MQNFLIFQDKELRYRFIYNHFPSLQEEVITSQKNFYLTPDKITVNFTCYPSYSENFFCFEVCPIFVVALFLLQELFAANFH